MLKTLNSESKVSSSQKAKAKSHHQLPPQLCHTRTHPTAPNSKLTFLITCLTPLLTLSSRPTPSSSGLPTTKFQFPPQFNWTPLFLTCSSQEWLPSMDKTSTLISHLRLDLFKTSLLKRTQRLCLSMLMLEFNSTLRKLMDLKKLLLMSLLRTFSLISPLSLMVWLLSLTLSLLAWTISRLFHPLSELSTWPCWQDFLSKDLMREELHSMLSSKSKASLSQAKSSDSSSWQILTLSTTTVTSRLVLPHTS